MEESISDLRDEQVEQRNRIIDSATRAQITPPPRQPSQHADLETLAARLARLEASRASASSSNTASGPTTPPTGTFTPGGPHTAIDPYTSNATILRVVADSHVPRSAIQIAIDAFVVAAGLPRGCYHLRGPNLSVFHSTHFDGTASEAAEKAKTILASLRQPDGTFRREYVSTPDGQDVAVAIYLDRSLADRARRAETRSTSDTMEAMGFKDIVADPRSGLIYTGWTPLASIAFDPDVRRATT